jgi:hypothetical protein
MCCGLVSRVFKETKAYFIFLGILLGKYCYFNEKGARSLIYIRKSLIMWIIGT